MLTDPYVRLATRTGTRTAMRGPTDHERPELTDLLQLRPDRHRRRAIRRATHRRGGPVAGCSPERCWHSLPHFAWTRS